MNKKLYFPIIIINCYFIITSLLHLFGPWTYRNENTVLWISYIVLFLLLITISYILSINNQIRRKKFQTTLPVSNKTLGDDVNIKSMRSRNYKFYEWYTYIGMIIGLNALIMSIMQNGVPKIDNIFSSMASAYASTQSGVLYQGQTDWKMWIYMYFATFVYIPLIVNVAYYKYLSKRTQIAFLITVFSVLAYFILYVGTQKTLGDFAILIASGLLIGSVISKHKKANKKKKWIIVGLIFLTGITLINVLGNRIGYLTDAGYNATLGNQYTILNEDSIWFKIFPKTFANGLVLLIFYISHGYYGLSLSLEHSLDLDNFTWSYGIGNMTDFTALVDQYLGTNIGNSTLPKAVEASTGYSASVNWFTIFPWLASDFTFLGTLLIMALISYLYAITWFEIVNYQKIESMLLFSLLNICWIYAIASNQLFAFRTTVIITIVVIMQWRTRWREHKRIKFKF